MSPDDKIDEIYRKVIKIETDIQWVSRLTKFGTPLVLGFALWSTTHILELQQAYAKVNTELRRLQLTGPKPSIEHPPGVERSSRIGGE